MKNLKTFKWIFCVILITSCFFYACEEKDFIEKEEVLVKQKKGDVSNLSRSGGIVDFQQTGPVGGGFPNVVTWDPNVPGKIYYGSDVGGLGRSTNYGKTFQCASRGLGYEDSHQKIATLNAIDVNGNTVIVGGTGFKGIGGEVISSTNGGNSWSEDSSDISFSAQNSDGPLPSGRPRSTDPTLIQWVSGSTWIAGTYKEGVWISTDSRASWNRLNLGNKLNGAVYVRAMAMSPINSNTVYVGLWGNSSMNNRGLWEIKNLKTTPVATKVSGVPNVVESIVVLGNRIYLACGKYGVRKYIPSRNKVKNISEGIDSLDGEVMVTAIHGVKRGGNTDRIVLGTANGDGSIWLSEDSGLNWTNTTTAGVAINPWGKSKDLIVFEKHPNWVLGMPKCDVATIQISPDNTDAWVVCSTSAIWTTVNKGATWRPANGYQILTYRDVEISKSGVIAAGNVDHDVIISNNGGADWYDIGLGNVTTVHGLAFSPNGSKLAFANNERDGNGAGARLGIASSPDTPLTPNIAAFDVPVVSKRIVGLSWVKINNNRERLIAAIDDGGIQTKDQINGVFQSSWDSRTSVFMKSQSNNGLRCSVVNNGAGITFIYDRESGVWRTKDFGNTWTKILDEEAGTNQGYLAYDKTNAKLYVSTPNQVMRINNPLTSNTISKTNLSFPSSHSPGAMALDSSGSLVVYGKPKSSSDPDCALFLNNNPRNNTNWNNIADNTFKRVAPPVRDLDIRGDTIVIVTSGKGMLISTQY